MTTCACQFVLERAPGPPSIVHPALVASARRFQPDTFDCAARSRRNPAYAAVGLGFATPINVRYAFYRTLRGNP